MNKDQIIAFIAKWRLDYAMIAELMNISPACLSNKIRGANGQRMTEANVIKLNEILRAMRDDLTPSAIFGDGCEKP